MEEVDRNRPPLFARLPGAEPFAGGARAFRNWAQLPPVRTFPVSHAVLLALAGVVGLFAGIAAGLFSNCIALFQILFFRPGALVRVLEGDNPHWWGHFQEALERAPWHPEYVGLAVGALLVSRLLAHLAERKGLRLPLLAQAPRIRAIGWLIGFGLVLYYPLLVLTTFNRAFGAAHGPLTEMVSRVPIWWAVLVPALGGLAAGLLVRYVTPESGGHGVAEVIETLNVRGRRIPSRVAVWKSITAGLVVGSGGSAGREGPVVQIGGAIANGLGSRFALPAEDVSLLLACGGAAGIAASFNSPIGGTLFALEILLGDFRMRSIAPIAFAAVAATITGRTLTGAGGEVVHVPFHLQSGLEMGPYVLLGAVAAVVAVAYVRSVHGIEHVFAHGALSRIRLEFKPMLGGLAVGVIGLAAPRVLGNGYETMNDVLQGGLPAGLLVGVLLAKIVASGLTLGSGSPGGSFFPAVMMGALLGGAFGSAGHALLPSLIAGSGAYAAVGMAAVVSAATQAPLTGILMLFELTGSYEIILPLMLACSTAVAGAHWVLGGSMYTIKLRAKGVRLQREVRSDLLHETTVAQAMAPKVCSLPAATPFDEVLRRLREEDTGAFAVLDARARLLGLLTIDEVRPLLGAREASVLVAADLCRLQPPTILPTDTLDTALARMAAERLRFLPVVSPDDATKVVGVLSEEDLVRVAASALQPLPAAHAVAEPAPDAGHG